MGNCPSLNHCFSSPLLENQPRTIKLPSFPLPRLLTPSQKSLSFMSVYFFFRSLLYETTGMGRNFSFSLGMKSTLPFYTPPFPLCWTGRCSLSFQLWEPISMRFVFSLPLPPCVFQEVKPPFLLSDLFPRPWVRPFPQWRQFLDCFPFPPEQMTWFSPSVSSRLARPAPVQTLPRARFSFFRLFFFFFFFFRHFLDFRSSLST